MAVKNTKGVSATRGTWGTGGPRSFAGCWAVHCRAHIEERRWLYIPANKRPRHRSRRGLPSPNRRWRRRVARRPRIWNLATVGRQITDHRGGTDTRTGRPRGEL